MAYRFPNSIKNLYAPIMILLIILIGFFLRLYHIAAVPLRGDEAFSVQYWAGQPLAYSLTKIATLEPHPVLTYALFRGWGLVAGTTEFTMRLLPVLANMLGIPALYIIGRSIGGQRVGLLAALVFALHPFEIWHAQDVRNYAIWAGASAVTLALGLRALQTGRGRNWLLYALAAAITANIFYFEWLTLVAFGFFVLLAYRKSGQIIGRWLISALPAILTSATSFLILQGNLIGTGSYGGTTASRLDVARLLTWFLPTLIFGDTLPADFAAALWPFIALALLIGVYILWRHNRRLALFAASLALLPFIALALASARLNIFDPRYILSAIPAYILLLVAPAIEFPFRKSVLSKIMPVLALGGWLLVAAFSLHTYFFTDYAKSKNWPALTQYLQENVTKSDLVLQLSVDPAFGYYYHSAADAPALPEKPSQPADEIRSILEKDLTSYRSIWIVGQTFPDWPNTGVVEKWLDSNAQLIRAGQIDGLNYRQYLPWQVKPNEIQAQPLTIFGGIVELVGAQVFLPPEREGNLTVQLYWRPLKTSAVPLKVFVHLMGDTNPATGTPLWTQDDHFPQNGRISSADWTMGTVYRDIYTLPLKDVPSSTYSLSVGFYDPNTGSRLSVDDTDSYTIQTTELK